MDFAAHIASPDTTKAKAKFTFPIFWVGKVPELLDKWLDKTLTRDDIKEWLKEQGQIRFLLEKGVLTDDDLDHIAECMHQIYRWYHDEVPCLGHFLTAVVTNSFMAVSYTHLTLPTKRIV